MQFYAHESCGKCTPCREGTWWVSRVLGRIEEGYGRAEDIPLLDERRREHPVQGVLRAGRRRGVARSQSTPQVLPRRVRGARRGAPVPVHRRRAGRRDARRARARTRAGGVDEAGLTEVADVSTPRAPGGPRRAHDRRQGGDRPQGDADHPRRRAAGDRDPPVLRSPAAGSGRRLPAVLRRGRGAAQAVHLVHDAGRAGHGRPHAEHRRTRRTRPRSRTSSSCCSTTRSTARSATAAASARCRTRRWRSGPGESRYVEAEADLREAARRCRRSSSLDRERCVLCARCTRFCDQISRRPVHRAVRRGARREQVAIARGRGLPVAVLGQHGPDLSRSAR